jgi:mannitol/fructose-specific phosphotransferase system IIA component (Ntr-type)
MKEEELEKINPILKETFQPLLKKGFITEEEFNEIITSEISSPDTYLVNLFGQSRTNEIETAMKLDHAKSNKG